MDFFSLQFSNFVIVNSYPSGSCIPRTALEILSHLARLGTGEEKLGGPPGGGSRALLKGKSSRPGWAAGLHQPCRSGTPHLLPPAPVSTLFSRCCIAFSRNPRAFPVRGPRGFPSCLPLALRSPAAWTLEPVPGLTTPCPLWSHLHQGPVWGAAGRVGKARWVCGHE